MTKRIEALCATVDVPPIIEDGPSSMIDPRPAYLDRILALVDLAPIRSARPRILANPVWGTGRGYLDEALRRAGARVETICDRADPTFGGRPPEPAPAYVPEMIERLGAGGHEIGLATDGDADRFGVFDADGTCLEAGEVIALLLDDLAERLGPGVAVRTIPTTHLIDAVAQARGCEVVEVPVGFKWIADVMTARPGEFLIGGEESGGLTIRGHLPEKDGILACLLVAALCARRGKGPRDLIRDLRRRVGGGGFFRRVNLRLDPASRGAVIMALAERPPAVVAGRRVVKRDSRDGFKFVLEDGAWVAVRFSGTEPVVRVYVEAPRPEDLDDLVEAGRGLLAAPREVVR
jgi:phosphomannomutase